MKRYLRYLIYATRHKWLVFWECVRLGIPLRGLTHDWHKFLPSEFIPYARHFFTPDGHKVDLRDQSGYYSPHDTESHAFNFAWYLHQKRARHHWQSWVLPTDNGNTLISMDDPSRREMLADWRGASRALGGSPLAWYQANRHKIFLHHETRDWIERRIGYHELYGRRYAP